MKLNLGCGKNWKLYPEYDGMDILNFGQKYVLDIFRGIPITPGGWEEIMANHFLEHFNQDQLKYIFPLVHSVLSRTGIFKFVVPHKDRQKAWVLSHKTFWNEETVRFLVDYENAEIYGFGKWDLVYVLTNEKKDIHAALRKVV